MVKLESVTIRSARYPVLVTMY